MRGAIPNAVGSWLMMEDLQLNQRLSGAIPHAVRSMRAIHRFWLLYNSLRGPIPDAIGSMQDVQELLVVGNSLRGPIPHAVGRLHHAREFKVSANSLRGPIPNAVGSMSVMKVLHANDNSLRGPIPHVVGLMRFLSSFVVSGNSLCGAIPHAICAVQLSVFSASHNELSGSIPSDLSWKQMFVVTGNRLTGTLSALKGLGLVASGNLFEGGLPHTFSSKLFAVLDLSGVPGRSRGLLGRLPPALRRLSKLKIFTLAHQQVDGGIPSFTSTLSLLALQNNHLKLLSEFGIVDDMSTTMILLHNNLLSCCVPTCGNASAKTSVIAIGNRLRYPKREFPTWVLKYERDPLLWISGTDGMSLVKTISGASCLFIIVVASKLGSAKVLRAMSGWQFGPATHLWVVKAESHICSRLAADSPMAAVFIVVLLSKAWDLYVCPQTLATVSACSQSSALIGTLTFLFWCKLCFHSLALEHLTMEGKKQKKWTAEISSKRLLLWVLWHVLIVVLSTPAILYQLGKSVPGSLQMGRILSLALNAGIGATQAAVGNFITPYLANKIMWHKHVFKAVASLLMHCVVPALVTIYLDTGCLGRWVSFWKTCRSNSELFQRRVICTEENTQDCKFFTSPHMNVDFMVLRPSDICDPQVAWTFSSMSRCIHITLFRLQEIWLGKFITMGLAISGLALARGKLPRESGAIVSNFGITMAYALVSSGHLPLMNGVLLLAFLGDGLVARVAWLEEKFEAKHVADVAAPVANMARVLSMMVHLASAAGDRHTLVIASAYIVMLVMANA